MGPRVRYYYITFSRKQKKNLLAFLYKLCEVADYIQGLFLVITEKMYHVIILASEKIIKTQFVYSENEIINTIKGLKTSYPILKLKHPQEAIDFLTKTIDLGVFHNSKF